MDASPEGKGCEQIGKGLAGGDAGAAGVAGCDFTGDVGVMVSGIATGWDRIGESGAGGLLTFWSSEILTCASSPGRNGSGKNRTSGDSSLQGAVARSSFESYTDRYKTQSIISGTKHPPAGSRPRSSKLCTYTSCSMFATDP